MTKSGVRGASFPFIWRFTIVAVTAAAADLSVSAPSLRRIFSNKPTFVGRI